MSFWLLQSLNGISFGMLLFLLAAGLTLIYGLMRIINLAHGSFFVLGAYIGLTVVRFSENFFLAIVVGASLIGILGILIYRFLLHRFMLEPLPQVLLTFGLLFFFADLTLWIWGGVPELIAEPKFLSGGIDIGTATFPIYRLFVIVVGMAVAIFLWWFQERTRFGAIIRAGIDDPQMAQGIGLNVPLTMALVFALGASIAALGGVIGGPILGVYPGEDMDVLLLSFAVVIIGGPGSLSSAFLAALLVGLVDNIGKILFPQFSLFFVFAIMAATLAIKPTGLFRRA